MMIRVMLLAIVSSAAVTTPAYAYVDPGTGTFLLQILAAIFFGALFYLRRIRNFFVNLVRPQRRDKQKSDAAE